MHFSKTYSQILQDLPPELRDNAIQYRQLKKLINQIVSELSALGLSPNVLQELITIEGPPNSTAPPSDGLQSTTSIGAVHEVADAATDISAADDLTEEHGQHSASPLTLADIDPLIMNHAYATYEVIGKADRIEPHLKLWVMVPDHGLQHGHSSLETHGTGEEEAIHSSFESTGGDKVGSPKQNLLRPLYNQLEDPSDGLASANSPPEDECRHSMASTAPSPSLPSPTVSGGHIHKVIIPLVSDTKFFKNLSSALESMFAHLHSVRKDFQKSVGQLSVTISQTALPASASPSFSPHSALTSHAGSVQVSSNQPAKSDLYSWREIFQLYVDTEVFEHVGEVKRSERSVKECERRMKLFVDQATQRGLAHRRNFKSKQSRGALERFIELNLFILNIKKYSEANSEATRKILKKHTKRTHLPLPSPFTPSSTSSPSTQLTASQLSSSPLHLFTKLSAISLPRTLVQAIGETLLPIIPHVDDYSCLICTSIAFKPIRLSCGHLFCVRCLVKMQKRNNGDCPICRAPVVLSANGSNVDWALLNFMQDWFPVEAREKLKANEKEASDEELMELGIDPNKGCAVM